MILTFNVILAKYNDNILMSTFIAIWTMNNDNLLIVTFKAILATLDSNTFCRLVYYT